MDKNAIKKYAVWARNELIARVSQKAQKYGFTKEGIVPGNADSVNGVLLTDTEKKQRQAMIKQVNEKGLEQVIEEISYTWFNRFAALRFMEVNAYLPSHVRVFTDVDNNFKPQILAEAIHLDIDGLNMDRVYELKQNNKTEELFRYLLITQCNALSKILPGMFQKISDYTELMLPDNLLREGSVIEQMVTMIPEEDWTDQVQIIGWLYQYYNTEPKDKVFADLKKNIKISKEKIPAATQLFTPDWIVHYMVENSLGRLWLEGHPGSADSLLPTEEEQAAYAAGDRVSGDTKWHYYLAEAQQEPEVEARLAEIRKEYATLKPEEILCIDPCMGSGHILCVLFDTLVQIYEDYGYTAREAARSIIENNLWGLDIDDRAAQLAYFAVMMKARQYDRRFLSRKDADGNSDIPQPHVYAIAESNHVSQEAVQYFCNGDKKLTSAMQTIIRELHDAKEYGSILTITRQDWTALYARFDEIRDDISMFKDAALALEPLVQTAQALGQKYWVTVTNPPYASVSNLSSDVINYVTKNFADSKSDLFAVFIERCKAFSEGNAYYAMITQHSWMFLTTFEKLRRKLCRLTLINMVHLGAHAFEEISGEIVQAVAFVHQKSCISEFKAKFARLVLFPNSYQKEQYFLSGQNQYMQSVCSFESIPGHTYMYWASGRVLDLFKGDSLEQIYDIKSGLSTGDNEIFVRYWHEIDAINFSVVSGHEQYGWIPYNKGGGIRKWYGLNSLVVYWGDNADKIKAFGRAVFRNPSYYFREGITWSGIASSGGSFRYTPRGFLFDSNKGPMIFSKNENLCNALGLLNSKVSQVMISLLNPTISLQIGDISSIPYAKTITEQSKDIDRIVADNIEISREDWDSFEISWDFTCDPMVVRRISGVEAWGDNSPQMRVEASYKAWQSSCETRYQNMKSNEEELNRIFIDIYGLQDELTPDVADRDVTVRRFFDTKEDIPESVRGSAYALTKQDAVKSLVSYAVGCMFGRYSLDEEGLAYAGGEWDASKYKTFPADKDAIIPVCDDEYFTDDIVGLFVKFIETVYGMDTLEENLRFIADALGGRGSSREVIRNYFLNDFYNDHLKTYQKRPIYWLFDSGKKNGFKCLIYMHRYQPDTIARIRTDYVHEQQSRYRTVIADLEQRINSASTSERVKLNKQLQKLQGQDMELRLYEEKVHHLADQYIPIDLDDGVKVNYAKFQDVLAKIK